MTLVQAPFVLQNTIVAHIAAKANYVLSHNIEPDYEYILDCTKSIDKSTLSIALSNNKIQLRDALTLNLISEFSAHEKSIHELYSSRKNPHTLYSCSSDCTAKLWDLRAKGCAQSFACSSEIWSHSLGCDETLLAVGTNDIVHFFDVRSAKKLGQYDESHVDAVTKVRFHPVLQTHIVTASEDGIVCLFDCTISKESDAIISIINAESSVSQIGFYGPKLEGIFCLTGTETLDLWELETASRIAHFPTIREELKQMKTSIDYLVNCKYNKDNDKLMLVGGDHNGGLQIFQVNQNNIYPVVSLFGGHNACIRSFHWDEDALITTGEDSRVCMWKSSNAIKHKTNRNYKIPTKQQTQLRAKPY